VFNTLVGLDKGFNVVPELARAVNTADAYALIVQRKSNWTHTRRTQRADPSGLLSILFHSKGFSNSTGCWNPRVDELLDRAAATYEPERRKPSTTRRSG
jgi:peptide/nickel transport system substrate-binding protein